MRVTVYPISAPLILLAAFLIFRVIVRRDYRLKGRLARLSAVAFGLAMIGNAILWPSWYNMGAVALYAAIIQIMVLTEEEHLLDSYGEEYRRYCRRIPRYLGLRRRFDESA
jgi:hypothetical protein